MKKITTLALLVSTAVWMGSCGNSNKTEFESGDSTATTASTALKPMTNTADGSLLHLYFDLTNPSPTDSSIVYDAKAEYNNEPVGFKVEVLKTIDAGINAQGQPDEELGFRKGSVRITSNGAPSDNFVKSLGTLFNLPTDGKMTTNTLVPLVFSSNKEKVDLSKPGTYSFKYFFDNSSGKEAEIFGYVDTYKQSFELGEKDSTNRAALISAFEGK
ncbi:hypothetical protein [Sphingobacterium mizutaii]|uniref:hypothetical protein n=1 Tax=Sphingobacterium mizutaii TaxID=1010 RepID=UPI002896B553|nr:hypothetical protein [Sphingobacterium mizutaii]